MGMKPETVKGMGLVSLSEARLLGGEAKNHADGSATLTLRKGFGGFAEDIIWTETYTLPAGQPVLTYRTVFETKGAAKRYLAYVDLGGGMRGDFGNLLRGKQGFKYQDPKAPNGILLSGNNNSHIRLGWRGERCWVGVDSELGTGIGVATTKDVTRALPGNSVWSFGYGGFFARLIDPVQENFPYEFSAGHPLDLGLAFVATSGGADIWNQTRQFFAAVTHDKSSKLASSCAVFLNGEPLMAGEVRPSTMRRRVVRRWRSPSCVTIAWSPKPSRPRQSIRSSSRRVRWWCGETHHGADVGATGRKGSGLHGSHKMGGQTAGLHARSKRAARRATLTLALEPAVFPAPELETPSDGMQLTDIAAFFRWQQVKGAIDYELQLARDAAFTAPKTRIVRSEIAWPYHLPADDELPVTGHVVLAGARGGARQTRRVVADAADGGEQRPRKETRDALHLARASALTIEACRVKDMSKFTHTIPDDLKPYVAINCEPSGYHDVVEYLKPLHTAGQTAFIRTHGPGPMSYWNPLAIVEAVFQAYPNVIGIMGGETLSRPLSRRADADLS